MAFYLKEHCPTEEQLFNFNYSHHPEVGTSREQCKLRVSLLPYGRNVRGITWNSNAFFRCDKSLQELNYRRAISWLKGHDFLILTEAHCQTQRCLEIENHLRNKVPGG